MKTLEPFDAIITVSLNPAIDRVIEVPDFAVGAHQKSRPISRQPAGKAINVSRILGRLDIDNIATGFVGAAESELFHQSLAGPHTRAELIAIDSPTRENITITDPINHRDTHIRDASFEIGAQTLKRLHKKLHVLCRDKTLVIFSGSADRKSVV